MIFEKKLGSEENIESLIKELDPRDLALGIRRTEADIAGKNLYLYRKGAKSMLQNFVKDNDFVEQVMDYFDWYYRDEDMDQDVQIAFEAHQDACEEWTHGEPIGHWTDEDGNFCIRYRDGSWWHYDGLVDIDEPIPITWW